MNAKIVLGLGFGDEGKGITTDFLCSQSSNPIVIRFSGGQQAGHTVIKDGIKHIHSNFGSGTLRGVPSYFSEHASIYLNTIAKEKSVLADKGITDPKLYVHPLTKMTTPYDVVFNRMMELRNQHGSCGLGISTTMKRQLNTGYKLHAIDVTNYGVFEAKLFEISKYYIHRCIEEKLNLDKFLEDVTPMVTQFLSLSKQKLFEVKGYSFLENFDDLIFEGSQGIMLDMDHGIFPNVTFANTTSKNAIEIAEKVYCSIIDIYYITRCYQTRHGNGWMSSTDPIKLVNNNEEINTYNEWQKEFKVSELDYNLLNYALDIDSIYSSEYSKNLVITCLDQRPSFQFNFKKLNQQFDNILESHSPYSESMTVVGGYINI